VEDVGNNVKGQFKDGQRQLDSNLRSTGENGTIVKILIDIELKIFDNFSG
jgi:hypothetical protein